MTEVSSGIPVPDLKGHLPSAFLRARRPERFSDTKKAGRPVLSRDLLEYKLETLTSRKQEVDFETFAWKLAERELCPNLLPQTGPTGGGDSHTDTSTYPVSPDLSERWFRGVPNASAHEFWAFAVSAKKAWRAKVRSDIAKISALTPRPSLAYFITNQFVRDRDRADLEKELLETYSLPVKILDRSWIVERTIEYGHVELAILHLGIDAPSNSPPPLGPRDAAAEAQLSELIHILRSPDLATETDFSLCEKYLKAARLSRQMEKPRHETAGLLQRAIDLSNKSGIGAQRLRAVYEAAWTSFWWHDDPATTSSLYREAEVLALASDDATDAELLVNLFSLLLGAVHSGSLSPAQAQTDARFVALDKHLERLAGNLARPNNSLQAKADRAVLQLTRYAREPGEVGSALETLRQCLSDAKRYGLYPATKYTDLVSELGPLFGDHPAYEPLFEEACRVAEARDGEISRGLLLHERGFQLLAKNQSQAALRHLSDARQLLSKHETLEEATWTDIGLGLAYEQVGLFWAARMDTAAAFQKAMHAARSGNSHRLAAVAALRLLWLEIQLGRVPHIVAWHTMASGLLRMVESSGEGMGSLREELLASEVAFGAELLRAGPSELRLLVGLPSGLKARGLFGSELALLYALGYDDVIAKESPWDTQTAEERLQFFLQWASAEGVEDLPHRLSTYALPRETCETVLFGSTVSVISDVQAGALAVCESILGALEAFFATGLLGRLQFHIPLLRFDVRLVGQGAFPPPTQVKAIPGGLEWGLSIPADVLAMATPAEAAAYRKWMLELIVDVASHAGQGAGTRQVVEGLRASNAIPRALDNAPPHSVLGSGDVTLGHYIGAPEFPLLRSTSWRPLASPEHAPSLPTPAHDSEPPQPRRHRDMLVVNVINLALWDKAKWKGVALLGWEGNQRPPGFCLLFEEAEAGKAIFREWRERFQGIEAEKWLRVSVVEGLDGGAAYAVHLTAHIDESLVAGGAQKTIATVSRFHVLNPAPGSVTLSRLREEYARHGAVFLLPAVATTDGPHAHWDLAVRVGRIEFRHVRDIGEHDMDSVVLRRTEAKPKAHPTSAAKKARRRRKKLARKAKRRARK